VILPEDWTEEGGQLTPSLKLKRNVVVRECKDEIAALFG
jgi:long-chain acyl-CoA synthetase